MVNDFIYFVLIGINVCLKWYFVKYIKIVGEDIGLKYYVGIILFNFFI